MGYRSFLDTLAMTGLQKVSGFEPLSSFDDNPGGKYDTSSNYTEAQNE
jgi:hypothetical protein